VHQRSESVAMLRETRVLREPEVLLMNGLPDHGNLYEGISRKLPADLDKALLRELMEVYRKGGKQRLEERIQELIERVGSETQS
jgi:hypothetical protein